MDLHFVYFWLIFFCLIDSQVLTQSRVMESAIAEFQKIKLRPIPKVKRRAPQPPVSLRLPKNVRQLDYSAK